MKKVMVLCLIVALAFGATGATCMQTVQNDICNPPASVIAVAQAAAPLIATAINLAIPGSSAYVTAVTVQAVTTAILGGACVSVTQLNALIAWLQSSDAKALQVKAQVKAGPMKATAFIDVSPLIAWRDGVK